VHGVARRPATDRGVHRQAVPVPRGPGSPPGGARARGRPHQRRVGLLLPAGRLRRGDGGRPGGRGRIPKRVRRRGAGDRHRRGGLARAVPGGLHRGGAAGGPGHQVQSRPVPSEEEFDAIVVGAGPGGVSAALTMARGGLSVVLFERGERPGVKNVMGGVMYGRMLADVVPECWKTAPMERVVTDERLWLTTADSVVTAGHKHLPHTVEPPNAFTVLRVPFDGWFAAQAEAAGALLIPGTTVEDVIREHGRVVGVRTGREEGELRAHLVVIADGANSFLVQKAGLGRPLEPNAM